MQEDRQLGASAKHFGCKWGGWKAIIWAVILANGEVPHS